MKTAYQAVLDRIAAAQRRSSFGQTVKLIAVSKTKPIEAIASLYALGQRDFGENYIQELLEKKEQAERLGLKDIRWHFIGHLQSNKIKQAIACSHEIQSIDSVSLAQKLDRALTESGRTLPVWIQVNIDLEESKDGFEPNAITNEFKQLASLDALKIQGLMAIPKPGSGAQSFMHLRELRDSLQKKYAQSLRLSMGLSIGMSDDFEQAIEQGSTCVRIGSLLFGARG